MGAIHDWGDAFITAMAGALAVFMTAIPKLIAFILILVIGWFLASLIAKGVAVLLRKVRFNDLAERAGLTGFLQNMNVSTDAAGFLAAITKWFVRLIALVVAFDALGLPAVSDFLRQVLLWLPNLVVALVILVIGGLAAKALSRFVEGVARKANVGNPQVLALIASIAVWAFTTIVVVNQIGIGVALVNTLFMATVGALALGLGLAFGLGGRETAARIVEKWYSKSQAAAPKVAKAADVASKRIKVPD